MLFSDLAVYLQKLEKTSSRNEITIILAELFKKTDVSEINKVTYLLSGKLLPSYAALELNLAEKMMFQSLSKAFQTDLEEVKKLFKKEGDLGIVAEDLSKNKESKLTINNVYDKLFAIAKEGGSGSQERKIQQMAEILSQLDSLSARYVARIPVGRLRLGFSDMTILDALSTFLKGDKSARKEIEAAFNVTVDLGKIAQEVKEEGLKNINKTEPVPGTPIRPSLAERLPSAEKILEKVGKEVYVEPKYDGFRTQAHIFEKDGKKVITLFSRNLENTTQMFPDLVESLLKIKVKNAILDGEAIGFDQKTQKYLPFQETIQRKRKHGIEEAAKNFPLKYFIFDILYKDGKSLLNLPFSQRREILEETITPQESLEITRQEKVTSADVIRDLIKKYLAEGLEGAMIKKIDASYKAGGRGYHWVKYKKTTEKGVADTIDCLVMGVYKGKGKRTSFGAGAFLVGIKDQDKFKTVSKIGTGLTDEQWRELDKRTEEIKTPEKPQEYLVDKNLNPDVWVKPSLVVEILADEITKSPLHSATLALRFPRLIKFRDEKGKEEVTSLKELQKLFEMQKV